MTADLMAIQAFLPCPTPDAWVNDALTNPAILLIDHANCEKKAASTALSLLYRYTDKPDLLHKMSRLAREELRHFEQVIAIMHKRGIEYKPIGPSRYAAGLYRHARTHEPAKLIDTLIIGAYVEARSCERFARLVPHLDEALGMFYQSLFKSEARHFQDYLTLAQQYADEPIEARVKALALVEQALVEFPDEVFRFHSGPLVQ